MCFWFKVLCLDCSVGVTKVKYHVTTVLTNVIEEMGNLFIKESNELLVLHTRDVTDPLVVDAVQNLKKMEQEQYNSFVTEHLIE